MKLLKKIFSPTDKFRMYAGASSTFARADQTYSLSGSSGQILVSAGGMGTTSWSNAKSK